MLKNIKKGVQQWTPFFDYMNCSWSAVKKNWPPVFELLMQRGHYPAHLRIGCRVVAKSEDMLPLREVGIDDNLGLGVIR